MRNPVWLLALTLGLGFAQIAPQQQEGDWLRGGIATPQARAVIGLFKNAEAKGLNPDDYGAAQWDGRLDTLRQATPQQADVFDHDLTEAATRYVKDVALGRANPALYVSARELEARRLIFEQWVCKNLTTAPDVNAAIRSIEPPFPAYYRTEKALAVYRQLAQVDDGEKLPAIKKTIDPGATWGGVPRLATLLRRLGDLPANAVVPSNSIYQGPLVDAVKHFQARHGLEVDGRIGKGTLEALNAPLSERVVQLELELERLRWLPHSYVQPPVIVNIPEFKLRVLDSSFNTALEMKVIDGKARRWRTPLLAGEFNAVIFRPYWNVPESIARQELVPDVERDPDYLVKNNEEVVTPGGEVVSTGVVSQETLEQIRAGELRVRQRPGPKNALGGVKFAFPNREDVYLHDTPAKRLFEKSRRDLSHGCVRVEKAEDLAVWMLRGVPGWPRERIQQAMNGTETLEVKLKDRIPVLIVYQTARVTQGGEVHFFADIYGRDAALEKELTSAVRAPRPRG
jgi:murein L,D-transpeptidase YcbB/YkuD